MSALQSRKCSRFEGLRFAFAFHNIDTLSPPLPLALAFSAIINATTSFCRGVSWVYGFTGAAGALFFANPTAASLVGAVRALWGEKG
jgi:hypothetical protein